MMCRPYEFDLLEEPLKSDLLYLRGQRDAIARDLASELSDERADRLIEDLVLYRSTRSAVERLKRFPYENHARGDLVDLLYKLSLRVARLERERCRYPIHEHDLLEA